jgi:uncharacterized protein with von Willebrand factor type A (vWA) domain
VLLSREEQRPIFDQAFRLFWRDPKLTEKMMQMLLPKTYGRTPKPEEQQSQRLTDALFGQNKPEEEREPRVASHLGRSRYRFVAATSLPHRAPHPAPSKFLQSWTTRIEQRGWPTRRRTV